MLDLPVFTFIDPLAGGSLLDTSLEKAFNGRSCYALAQAGCIKRQTALDPWTIVQPLQPNDTVIIDDEEHTLIDVDVTFQACCPGFKMIVYAVYRRVSDNKLRFEEITRSTCTLEGTPILP